jgi:hypothetical protein
LLSPEQYRAVYETVYEIVVFYIIDHVLNHKNLEQMKKEAEFSKDCKIALWGKLAKAITKENLRNKEVSNLLKVNPVYISMIRNPKSHDKCPNGAWRRIQEWANSGETIEKFASKYADKLEFVGKEPGMDTERKESPTVIKEPKKKAEFKKITKKEIILQSAEDRNKSFESLWNQYQADQQDGFVSNLESWLEEKVRLAYPGITFEEAKAHFEQCITAGLPSLPKLLDDKDPAGGPFIIIYDDGKEQTCKFYENSFADAMDHIESFIEASSNVNQSAKIVSFKTLYRIDRQVVRKSYV